MPRRARSSTGSRRRHRFGRRRSTLATNAGSRGPRPELRTLPSVDELAGRLIGVPHAVAVRAAREAIAERRAVLAAGEAGESDLVEEARRHAEHALAPALRRIVNATGVIVHTNLGRAPLAAEAVEAAAHVAGGYSNVEFDLTSGRRGSRHQHVESLLCELTGAEAAHAVNNCAGAVLLATAALAAGHEVVVSRGQLIEIGGSFRVPDVIAQSGARLVEVGTTNRTRLADYERVFGEATGAVLRAHPSNFRSLGFVESVEIEALCAAAATHDLPVIDDAGSGALAGGIPELADEPPVRRSVAAGCALVCFSGDKLLGGPQAGLIVGRREAVERCRAHPLARALRIDKLSLAALEATLRLYADPAEARRRVPVLRMLTTDEATLAARAERMRSTLAATGISVRVIHAAGRVGGGALPLLELEGPVCAVEPGPAGADALARSLRSSAPPVVARIREGLLLLDPRTLDDDDALIAARVVAAALG